MASIQRKLLLTIILGAILVLAAASRFAALDRIPSGIYPDEALNGNEGLHAVETGDYQLFYPANNGREGLWINLTGLSVRYFGANQFGLRFWSPIVGTLAVVFVYLLATELFSARVGLFAAFLLATSYWHVNFSRLDFRAILVPTISLAAIYFLVRAWRTQSLWWAVIGGLIYGLGFHTYIAYRFTPIVIPALFYWGRSLCPRWKRISAVWLVAAFVAALPMGIYFVEHPQDFFGREQGISVFSQPHPAATFALSLYRTVRMFNRQGDCNPRHNLPCSPELPPPIGLLFLAGLALAIMGRAPRWIAIWLGVMILPGALTFESVPHALRTIGAIPPVFLLTALGADAAYKILESRKTWQWAFLVVVATTGLFEYYRYFAIWPDQPTTREAFTHNLVSIGEYLNALPDDIPRFIIVNADPVSAQTIIFVTQAHPAAKYLSPDEALNTTFPHGGVIVLLSENDRVFEALQGQGIAISTEKHAEFTTGIVQ